MISVCDDLIRKLELTVPLFTEVHVPFEPFELINKLKSRKKYFEDQIELNLKRNPNRWR